MTTNQPDPRTFLKQTFGFDDFWPGQEAVVSRLIEGKSVLAVFPTGAGKSLCFQLPAMLGDGLTLVISPLIALMKDQLDFLLGHGLSAARLDSTLDRQQTQDVFDAMNQGRLRLLYVSPERLNNERFLSSLGRRKIAMLAIDEAHCISQWGHNFRPDYLKLARLARELNVGRVLALTATATPEVADDIRREFNIHADDLVHTGFYRPNLNLRVTPTTRRDRRSLLLERLHERPTGPTIVYVTLQRTAEEVAELLAAGGFNAEAYHAGMKSEVRAEIQDRFMRSDDMIVVATIAFGMGIDKSNIRYVYHYNLPKGLESYSQEIGRAGRDGEPSVCEMLACADDVVTLENFTYGDTPTSHSVRGLVAEVLGQDEVFDVSTYDLSARHDVRPLVVRTALTYLELEDVITTTSPFYNEYRFQPQRSSQQILERFDADRAAFLRSVFACAHKGRTWFFLDLDKVMQRTGQPRSRIVAALSYLEESGDLVIQATGVRQGYRRLASPDVNTLALTLATRFTQREERDVERVDHVTQLAQHDGCLTQHLLAYFGERREPCGHCSRCEGIPAAPLPSADIRQPTDEDIQQIRQLIAESHPPLATPRQLTRFLCGLASPAATRAKLGKHPLFGRFRNTPFQTILAVTESCRPGS